MNTLRGLKRLNSPMLSKIFLAVTLSFITAICSILPEHFGQIVTSILAVSIVSFDKEIAAELSIDLKQIDKITPESSLLHIEKYVKNANNICLILDFNHQVAGKLEFRAGGQIRHQHKGWVDIAFLPAFRGKGFGSKMFEFFISWAKQNPTIEVINLQVVSDNIAAINLYKKFGFTEIGRDPYHEKVNGQYSVIITMQLFLKSAT